VWRLYVWNFTGVDVGERDALWLFMERLKAFVARDERRHEYLAAE